MSHEVTRLLAAVGQGDNESLGRLFNLVYDELRHSAHRQLSRSFGAQTLSTTVLVHECYLKLLGAKTSDWADQRHFFHVASLAMRQIIVDQARRRMADKRGSGARPLDLDECRVAVDGQAELLVSLEAALQQLASHSQRLAELVDLRFFAGLSVEDTARVLQVSDRTVKRDWRLARAFLHAHLHDTEPR